MACVVKIRDIVVSNTGSRNPTKKPDETFIYVDVAAVDNGAKVITGARPVLGAEAPSRARKLIRRGDVLVSTVRPNLNAVAMVPAELDGQVASTGFCVLRVTDQALPEYLYYFTRAKAFADSLSSLVAGAMYPAVTDSQVLDQELLLPIVTEQHRIVDLLSRAEGIVRLRREATKRAAELIPALFHDMFGNPATNPKAWRVASLGDIIVDGPQNGLYKHGSLYGEGTPILRIDAFYDGRLRDIKALKRVRATPEECSKFRLQHRNIVINRVNSVEYLGKSAIIPPLDEPTVFESNMMRFGLDESVALPEYVIELLQTVHAKAHFLAKAKHAINQSSINQQDVKSLPIMLPDLNLQRTFASRVEEVCSIQSQQAAAIKTAQAAFDALLAATFDRSAEGMA